MTSVHVETEHRRSERKRKDRGRSMYEVDTSNQGIAENVGG